MLNEITKQNWRIDGRALYRDLTEEEKSAYDKSRTEAVRVYFDGISKSGAVDDSSSTLRFKVPLDSSYSNSSFTLKDLSDKTWTIRKSDLIEKLNEITNQNWRIDGRALYRDATEEEKSIQKLKWKEQRDKEDDEFIEKVLAWEVKKIRNWGFIEYDGKSFSFAGSGYGSNYTGITISDEVRMRSILNRASVKAGYSPCYYQVQDGNRIYDSERWQLGTWTGSSWEKSRSIGCDTSKNGFWYGSSPYYGSGWWRIDSEYKGR